MNKYLFALSLTTLIACGSTSSSPAGGAGSDGRGGSSASGGSPAKAAQCVAGQQVDCACVGGLQGAQACKADGSGYLACACGAGNGAGGGGDQSPAGGDPGGVDAGGEAGASGGGDVSGGASSNGGGGASSNGGGGASSNGGGGASSNGGGGASSNGGGGASSNGGISSGGAAGKAGATGAGGAGILAECSANSAALTTTSGVAALHLLFSSTTTFCLGQANDSAAGISVCTSAACANTPNTCSGALVSPTFSFDPASSAFTGTGDLTITGAATAAAPLSNCPNLQINAPGTTVTGTVHAALVPIMIPTGVQYTTSNLVVKFNTITVAGCDPTITSVLNLILATDAVKQQIEQTVANELSTQTFTVPCTAGGA